MKSSKIFMIAKITYNQMIVNLQILIKIELK